MIIYYLELGREVICKGNNVILLVILRFFILGILVI